METQDKSMAATYMLLSSLSFALMQLIIKYTADKVPLFEQVFVRNAIVIVMMIYILYKHRSLDKLKIKEAKVALFVRSLCGFLGIALFFYSMRNINLADAAALQKSSPFFVMLFSRLILHEKMNKVKVGAIVIAFIGVLFVVKPQFNSAVIPAMLGLLSAVFSGMAYTMIAFMKNKVPSHVIIFYFSLLSCLMCIPFVVRDFKMPDPTTAALLLMIGILGGLGQSFLTASYKLADPGEVSVYNYSNIIFSVIAGYFLFGEVLDKYSLLGISLIIISGVAVYKFNISEREHTLSSKK